MSAGGHRARPSARDARKAERAKRPAGPAYITREIPTYELLSEEGNFVRLTCLSPWLHHSGGRVCEPVDVPVNKRHL